MSKYDIDNNWLTHDSCYVDRVECNDSKYSSGNNICDYILIHYTASNSLNGAHSMYKTKNVSWHLTIDLDGKVYQLLDFRKRAWHAGRSNWKRPDGRDTGGLNKWSIGIELINAGKLERNTSGEYITWYGEIIPQDKVFIDGENKAWQKYTEEQYTTLSEIIPILIDKYSCLDILGHSEVAPNRKEDPGKAFSEFMTTLRKRYINNDNSPRISQ